MTCVDGWYPRAMRKKEIEESLDSLILQLEEAWLPWTPFLGSPDGYHTRFRGIAMMNYGSKWGGSFANPWTCW